MVILAMAIDPDSAKIDDRKLSAYHFYYGDVATQQAVSTTSFCRIDMAPDRVKPIP